jgi:FkbM family methyltransferase
MDLNVNISQILRNNGYLASRITSEEALNQFLDKVKPIAIAQELTRVGGYGDGGYLLPDDFQGVEACFSPGVSSVASFEAELAEFGINSYLADYTVDAPPEANPRFEFDKRHIGDKNNHMQMRLEDWIHSKTGGVKKELILQMDIEGAEYSVILDTPKEVLAQFRIIVIEFHSLELLLTQTTFPFINQVFEKLLKDFCVVHIHPNNFAPAVEYKNFKIPPIMEFTFYRKDRATVTYKPIEIPHLLDSRNVFDKPDLPLPECWLRNLNDQSNYLRTISGVIHVGANSGQERFIYSKYQLNVIWIEPLKEIFDKLIENTKGFSNQIGLNYLITDRDGEVYDFYISDNEGASSSIFKPLKHNEIWPDVHFPEVTTFHSTTLPTMLTIENIAISDYQALVIDTQGSELLVLKGLGKMIQEFKYIVTEAADFEAYEHCCKLQELSEYLALHGFGEIKRDNMTARQAGGNYYEVIYAKIGAENPS